MQIANSGSTLISCAMLLLKDAKQIVFNKVLVHWVENWSSSLVFTFSARASSAFAFTLLSQVMLMNELFGNDSEFTLTSKFQCAPTERRFSQRKMSGGRFLFGPERS